MNVRVNISWTTMVAESSSDGGGNISNPEWRDIEVKLTRSLMNGGTVTLDAEDEDGCQSSLQVRAEGGNFVVMLGEETSDGWEVRTYNNSTTKVSGYWILGDLWSAQVVCHDINFVMETYREFFDTGDITKSRLTLSTGAPPSVKR